MKHIFHNFLATTVTFLAGCATHHHSRYTDQSERTIAVITTLYEETRTLETTKGSCRYVLGPDLDTVAGAETLLLHYSRNEDPAIRVAAACRLARFGTRPALSRALELARTEDAPEIRSRIWSAIAELLQEPLTWPAPQVFQITDSSIETNLSQALTSPDLKVIFSWWHGPNDFILPGEYTLETIEDAIISQFASDSGEWSVEVVDRIPFVPFIAKRHAVTLTVRRTIANTLHWTAHGNEHILRSFQEFSRSNDENISGPAKEVVSSLLESDALSKVKQRGLKPLPQRAQ